MSIVHVLGAGVIGLTTAYSLARRGHSVVVVDQAIGPGVGGASFRNGAQLSYAYADAMATPALRRKLSKLILGFDPSFRIKLDLSTDFVRWGLSFIRNSTKSRFDENTIAILRLASESRAAMADLLSRHPLSFSHRRSAKAHLYVDAHAFGEAQKIVRLKKLYDVEQEVLSEDEVIQREPALRAYNGKLVGAVWSPCDEVGDCHVFCCELAKVLVRDYDVKFNFETTVSGLQLYRGGLVAISTTSGEIAAKLAVVSLGSGSRVALGNVGIRTAIWPIQGYSITLPVADMAPSASITDTAKKVVFCRLGERVRIAGLADIQGGQPSFQANRLQTLLEIARSVLPKAANYSADPLPWTGTRPMTPSSQPFIGRCRWKGVYMNCGHGALGWTLAMGSAGRIARIIQTELYGDCLSRRRRAPQPENGS